MVVVKNEEIVNWDFFWKRVEKHPRFLQFLYFIHLKKYFKILSPLQLKNIDILELGAGTGTASRALIKRFGGSATLVDNNDRAYALHNKLIQDKTNIIYLRTDLFQLDLPRKYDLVFSDGLLEHFKDKGSIIELHKKFLKSTGSVLIFALQKNLFSSFLQWGEKKMGYSQPLPLKECVALCETKGLQLCGRVSYFFEYGVLCKLK